MKNLIIVIIVILIIFAFLSSVRFGFPNSRNPEVTKFWISDSQGYALNTLQYLQSMQSQRSYISSRLIVFPGLQTLKQSCEQ